MKAYLLVCTVVILTVPGISASADFYAYYTKIDSGQDWEKYSRTGKYADIVVQLPQGQFIFHRSSSYLPYWKTEKGKWYMPEIVRRKGDGKPLMTDKHNRYSYVRIIESTVKMVVVHWRYMPDFSNVSWHGVVDEYFVIRPDGKVTRIIRRGTPKLDDWNDLKNRIIQKLSIDSEGIKELSLTQAGLSKLSAEPVCGSTVRKVKVGFPTAWWKFDEGLQTRSYERRDVTAESIDGYDCTIAGHKSLFKKGISGTALAFDGYHSAVVIPLSRAPAPKSQLTIEAWVALGAYPFEWAPIISQAVWKDSGYYFGLDQTGHLGFHAKIGKTWQSVVNPEHLHLFRWYHVAATFDSSAGLITLFVDGKQVASQKVPKADLTLAQRDVIIGLNSQKMPAVDGRIRKGKWPSLIGFDGLIDELKLYDQALTADDICRSYGQLKPPQNDVDKPDLMQRRLPANPRNAKADRFGAEYTRLNYYDTWDNMWRVGPHPDVVVKLDANPTRFVFWRGLSYGIGLVTENGKWAGDQSSENYKELGADKAEGCCEHMSDKQCRHAHVRIIENTDARVVVHWRYGMVDSRYIFPDVNPKTGWGDWADEYWTIYPDAVGIRHLERGWIWADSWVETMFYSEPGTMPEDNVELNAYTLVNLKGETKTYSWEHGSPDCDLDDPVISMINTKSEYRPFNVYPTGSSVETFSGRPQLSRFPWWNHYPVSQITSDGRAACAPDRASHSSLVWGTPSTNYMMYGLTNRSPETLLPLAKSWNTPPQLLDTTGCHAEGYRPHERAYYLTTTAPAFSFRVYATEERPLFNPCFVIRNYNSATAKASIKIDGKLIPSGKDFRQGIIRDTDGRPMLIIWLCRHSEEPTKFEMNKTP